MADPDSALQLYESERIVCWSALMMGKALESKPILELTKGNPNASNVEFCHNRAAHLAKLRHLYSIRGRIDNQVRELEH